MNLAYFHAPWCGVCHEKSPVVEQIAADAGLPLERWDIEDDAGRAQAESRRIKTVPTLALIHGERVPFRLVGSMITPDNVAQMLARFTPSTPGA
jgi:thioredoxin-like negative regulator of GroEL